MTARFFVMPALLSLGLVACADNDKPDADSGTTQFGSRSTGIKGHRTVTEKPSWNDVHAQVDALPNPSSVLGFLPIEGTYNVESSVIHVDECGADASAFPAISHGVHDVNKRTGAYTTDYIDTGSVFAQAGCELDGHTYRCDSSLTTIDFNDFGLDAIVTINNGDFGVWAGQNDSFIGLNPYSVVCEGTQCTEDPAATVFGLITKPMPCTGIDGSNLTLQL